jgi:hypothetical protein
MMNTSPGRAEIKREYEQLSMSSEEFRVQDQLEECEKMMANLKTHIDILKESQRRKVPSVKSENEEGSRSNDEMKIKVEEGPWDIESMKEARQLSKIALRLKGDTPRLENLTKEAMRNFIKKYEEYVLNAEEGFYQQPQQLVIQEHLEVVALGNGCTIYDLRRLTTEDFIIALLKVNEAITLQDMEQRFRQLSMKRSDLQMATLAAYNADWRFEVRCAGSRVVLPPNLLKRIYVDGLRPVQLRDLVLKFEPMTQADAMGLAAEYLPQLRSVREQMTMFQGSPMVPGVQGGPMSNGRLAGPDRGFRNNVGRGQAKRQPWVQGGSRKGRTSSTGCRRKTYEKR